jgi:hypothetical protein
MISGDKNLNIEQPKMVLDKESNLISKTVFRSS